MVTLSDGLDMTIAVDWDVKPQTKQNDVISTLGLTIAVDWDVKPQTKQNDVISTLGWLEFRC